MSQELEGALPIIVTNYARAFGVKVRMQGSSAYTNGTTITIPRLDLSDPVTSRMAYGYLAHESAHVRYSDFQAASRIRRRFLLHTLVNIIEDARIERLIGRQFVGVWENLELLRSHGRGDYEEFRSRAPSMETLQLILAFVLFYTGAYCQRFRVLRPRAAFVLRLLRSRMDHATVSRICSLSLMVLDARSTSDAVSIAKMIINTINGDGVLTRGARGDLEGSRGRRGRSCGQKVLMRRFCDELSEAESRLKAGTGGDLSKVAPGADHAAAVSALGRPELGARDDLGAFEAGECRPGRASFGRGAASSSRLRRELSARVRAYVEDYGSTCSRGNRINPYRLALAPIGETRVFRDRIARRDNSTSVHLLVDSSGSMLTFDDRRVLTRCEAACRCALSLALALEGISGIHTMCSFFPGAEHEVDVCLHDGQRASERAAYFDQVPRGSTPLAQAIWHAVACAGRMDARRHVVIVITDGIPDSVGQARTALAAARSRGVEVFGIGICLEFIKRLIPCSTVISDPSDVLGAVFSMFSKKILPPAAVW
jgi:cobaltochelatase CobT